MYIKSYTFACKKYIYEIYMKELWRRGKYMLYFYFFLSFLFENAYMFVE